MSWHTVHLAEVEPAPWRNGGGMTRELAAWPNNGAWQWRMSVAEVEASGPFSRFEGVTRWFAVLQGAGVVLTVRASRGFDRTHAMEHRLTQTTPVLCFDADVPTQCDLIDGPTQDFNLMVSEACMPARMLRVRGAMHTLAAQGKTIAIYAVDAAARLRFNDEVLYLPPGTLVWRTLAKAAAVYIDGTNVLWMEVSA